jgi:1,2-diacylglycerol 3-beta-glucosyltransferase
MEKTVKNKKGSFKNRALRRLRIFNFWQGNNKDRFLLFGIIGGIYLFIKILEEIVPPQYLIKLPSNVSLTLLGLIILIMVIHAIYIFFAQYHRRRQPRETTEDFLPSVDIFISAHNEEGVIKETLQELLKIDYPELKIYAINDRSQDRTSIEMQEVADIAEGKIIVINRPDSAFPGKSAALNDALKISDAEIICVLDADARIEPDFLHNMVKNFSDPLVGAAQAQKVISNPEVNLLTRCQYHEYAMDTYLQVGRDSIRGAVELRGNGQLVRRDSLEDVGGWNEETLTDDLDLSTCLHVNGWDIRFSSENKVYEEGVPSFEGFIKQRRRWAEGSMRRYLNYFLQLMKPGNLSPVQIFDTFVFICEFSIPLWLSLDLVYEVFRLVQGRETYFSFLMLLSVGIGAVIFAAQFNGLRIYKNQKFFEAIVNSFITNAYLLSTWAIVILITYRKILFSRTVGTWTRTQHGGK